MAIVEKRHYQAKAITQIKEAAAAGHRLILFVLSMGGGKTTVSSDITKRTLEKGNNVMFIVHRKKLVLQARNRLMNQFGIKSGVVMAGWEMADYPSKVASIASLVRRERPDAQVVFIDEGHRWLSGSYQTVVNEYLEKGAIVILMTATPFRGDGQDIIGSADAIVHPITMLELIDEGYLVGTKIFIVKNIDFSDVKISKGDYDTVQVEGKLLKSNICQNVLDNFKEKLNCATIAFCSTVKMSKFYCDYFNKNGVPSAHLDGESTDAERDKVDQLFKSGRILVLFNVGLYTEGYDGPFIMAVLFLLKTMSPNKYLQIIGRCQRPYEGKEYGLVLDYGNNALEHGPPEQYDQVDFRKYNKGQRKKSKVRGKTCPSCFKVVSITDRKCECGQVFERVVEEFELNDGDVKVTMEIFKEDQPTVRTIMGYNNISDVPTEHLRAYLILNGKNPSQALYIAQGRGDLDKSQMKDYAQANIALGNFEKEKGSRNLYLRIKKKLKRK